MSNPNPTTTPAPSPRLTVGDGIRIGFGIMISILIVSVGLSVIGQLGTATIYSVDRAMSESSKPSAQPLPVSQSDGKPKRDYWNGEVYCVSKHLKASFGSQEFHVDEWSPITKAEWNGVDCWAVTVTYRSRFSDGEFHPRSSKFYALNEEVVWSEEVAKP